MSTEKHDPWALLREARESVFRDSLCREYDDTHKTAAMEEHKRRTRLKARIDAALAEHDAIPPSEEPVEWVSLCDGQENRLRLADGTRLYACSHGDGHWGWSVNRPSSYGYADTLDEAKSAAIAAARGTK